ncbi:MAG: hypothetical protein ACLU71_14845 [Blautia hansenii]
MQEQEMVLEQFVHIADETQADVSALPETFLIGIRQPGRGPSTGL